MLNSYYVTGPGKLLPGYLPIQYKDKNRILKIHCKIRERDHITLHLTKKTILLLFLFNRNSPQIKTHGH